VNNESAKENREEPAGALLGFEFVFCILYFVKGSSCCVSGMPFTFHFSVFRVLVFGLW
jgi:hypothetical protein